MMSWCFSGLAHFVNGRQSEESFKRPVVCGFGRDALKYKSMGRTVIVPAELESGEYERAIDRSAALKWVETGVDLTTTEREGVFRDICAHLDRKKVKWEFVDWGSKHSGNQ